ncbi:MAG: zinc metalloprotease HtpX [Gemmatimonadota bacterium]|nr:zinc metalloprotease HtpX [Gemmatimonadota bacterium]MDE3006485.1 zinc metalloprotease HtpX [Gemmatimonadota bacterium]MDE3012458.1 zinc metalloprotease HtpX [Gemmatimonadota bacterium]
MQMAKVFGLMTMMTILFVIAGDYIGGSSMAAVFFGISMVMNFWTFWFSDRAVLKMYRAQVIGPEDAPELYRMVDQLRQRADLPMPKVAIAPERQPNAFATGRNPENAVVCVTLGLMDALNERELAGVIAHELAHIKHRHMLVGTIAAGMAGAIALVGSILRWGIILGSGRDGDENPLAMLGMALVAPIVAVIVQMAVSRQNEFQADATAVRIMGDKQGLQSALRRIEAAAQRVPMQVNPAGAHMAIINPFSSGRGAALAGLFRTHPPTEARIQALEEVQL